MGTKALLETLLEDDPRYAKMFAIEGETRNNGIDGARDYTADLNALRDASSIHKGSLRELVGVPDIPGSMGPPRQAYSFLSYRACEIGFRENLIFSSEGYNESPGIQMVGKTILSMVGKPHRRLRATAQPLFKRPKVVDWWNKRWTEETVDALLDRLRGRDNADLNSELCARLPMAVVTRAFGLEGADALSFRYYLNRSSFGARNLPLEDVAEARSYVDRTLRQLIAQNLSEPGDNLIAGLLQSDLTEDDGSTRRLTEDELFGYCKLTIFAGGGTSWRQLGIAIDALLTNYHFWEACREDRSLIEQAVEEAIRWRTTTGMMPRLCVEDTELDGVTVPAGSRVFMCIASANHDPAVFEKPEKYDIFRTKRHHMGFGFGPHRCLGMDVARHELIVALNGLMDRWPSLRFDKRQPVPLFMGLEQRGMTAVPVVMH
jgi:cytochrome P450